MKLDRNTNTGEVGKYSLICNRVVAGVLTDPESPAAKEIKAALATLEGYGVLDHGNDPEQPGKQFFVMRYGDRLTHWGLWNYGSNALSEARARKNQAEGIRDDEQKRQDLLMEAAELEEFALEIHAECKKIEGLQTAKVHPMKYPTE